MCQELYKNAEAKQLGGSLVEVKLQAEKTPWKLLKGVYSILKQG